MERMFVYKLIVSIRLSRNQQPVTQSVGSLPCSKQSTPRHGSDLDESIHPLIHALLFQDNIQGVPGGKVNILEGHNIGHSKQKTLYEHVSYSKRFPR